MRKINKSVVVPKTLQNAPVPKNADEVDEKFYRADDVRKQLLDDQHNKCAYCESRIPKEYNDVEHYRPKSKYYWLGHDWNNLLYSCPLCNRSYKNDDFPLDNEANRVSKPGNIAIEVPLIINPAIEDPLVHIRYNRYMIVDITVQGKETIKRFHLNDRADLVNDRKELFELYIDQKKTLEDAQKIIESPNLPNEFKIVFGEIITRSSKAIQTYKSESRPYSGMLVNQ